MIPFPAAAKKAKTLSGASSMGLMAPFLLTLLVSFAVLVIGMVACKMLAPDVIFAFVIAEFVTFVIGVIVFGISVSKRR